MEWSNLFNESLPYNEFLDKYAKPEHRTRWDKMHAQVQLSDDQKALLGGFTRRMPVFALAGAWCGDCINQLPILDHFEKASKVLEVRYFDRDVREDVREALMINGGHRVPTVVFLSEDFLEVSRYGDRTLSTYRRMAAEQIGPACPTGLVPPADEALAAVTSEWLNEFERVQLLLRLSGRLRQKHGD